MTKTRSALLLLTLSLATACADAVGSEDASTSPPVAPDRGGSIILEVAPAPSGGDQLMMWSVFDDGDVLDYSTLPVLGGWGPARSCEQHAVGACSIVTCDAATPAPPRHWLTIGTITARYGFDLTSAPWATSGDDQHYTPQGITLDHAAIDAEDHVDVRASGGDIPAFDTTLPAPPALEVHDLPPWAVFPLSRSTGFTAHWTPVHGDVLLQLVAPVDTPHVDVVCRYDGSTGEGAVPPEAVAPLASNASVGATLYTSADRTQHLGPYDVRIAVRRQAWAGSANLVP